MCWSDKRKRVESHAVHTIVITLNTPNQGGRHLSVHYDQEEKLRDNHRLNSTILR